MPVLTPQQLGDLIATTNRKFGKPNFTEIATDLQEYTAFTKLVLDAKAQEEDGTGTGFQFDVMVNDSGSAENVGIGSPDQPTIVDTMVQAQVDWRGTKGDYSVFAEEITMNEGDSRIVNLLQTRQIACKISLAKKFETNWWGPPVAVTDSLTPWGVNTWIVKNGTEGFNGAAPSGHTTIGLNPSTYSNWKNYTAPYTAVTEDDLIDKWRRADRKTNFIPPVKNIPSPNTGDKYGRYTNEPVISALEKYLKSSNENLGNDLAKYQNEVMFRGAPVKWVPKLDADTTNPVYGINWGWFKMYVLKGWWFKETRVAPYPGYHTLAVVFYDFRYQFVTKNRRAHYVLSNGTSYPS